MNSYAEIAAYIYPLTELRLLFKFYTVVVVVHSEYIAGGCAYTRASVCLRERAQARERPRVRIYARTRSGVEMVKRKLMDGLYQVDYRGICAGFVIEGGRVTACAPVLRRRIEFWKTIAIRIGDRRGIATVR